jgi:signal transduction histidine kinase
VIVPASEAGHWRDRVDRWSKAHGWASDALTGSGLVVVLGVLSISGAQGMHWSPAWAVVLVTSFAVLQLSVVFRRFAPAAAYASASLAMLVIVLAPDGRVVDQVAGGPTRVPALFLPSSLVFLLVVYGVAARVEVAGGRVVLAVALVGVAIATASTADALRQFTAGGWLVTFYFGAGVTVSVLMAWNLGRLAAVRRARALIERAESARVAVLEERARIAREMHDIVAHSLAVIVRQAEGGAFVAERDPARAVQALQTIAEAGRGALTDMRGVLGALRDQEPGPSSRPTLSDLAPLVAGVREAGMHAELTESGVPFALGATTELAVYRLAQEGLTNAVKHAGPRARVAVVLTWQPEALIVTVVDDGGEAPVPLPVPGTGAGLQGMRERVVAVGGTFSAAPSDRGFQIRAHFPRRSQSSGGPG